MSYLAGFYFGVKKIIQNSNLTMSLQIQFSALLCGIGSNGLDSPPPPGFLRTSIETVCQLYIQSTRLNLLSPPLLISCLCP